MSRAVRDHRLRVLENLVVRARAQGKGVVYRALLNWVRRKWDVDPRTAESYLRELYDDRRVQWRGSLVVPGPRARAQTKLTDMVETEA